MSTLLAFGPSFQPSLTRKCPPPITCVSDPDNVAINRRNVCLGGGLYGAAAATFGAAAAPVQPPNITDIITCQTAVDPQLANPVMCCPPYGTQSEIIDFAFADRDEPLRRRRPAHKLETWEIARFREAVKRMKDYDHEHPWNWFQQAQIHCAFCNDGYNQVDYPCVSLQVHGSWLFPPWHRYYLYFWEKILGKLIGDPTFAVPYWEWDNPEGMEVPELYKNVFTETNFQKNSLYNCNRDADHVSSIMDLNYARGGENDQGKDPKDIIEGNLCKVGALMDDYLRIPECFMGVPIQAGQVRNGQGQLELLHNVPHAWVGQSYSPFWDMGNFHTAAQEPLFWAHHANVDRLWSIYRARRREKVEFPTPDWLDSSFVFYDENNKVVKCKVEDCLDHRKLGYDYERSDQSWGRLCDENRKKQPQGKMTPVPEFGDGPRELKGTIRARVTRPKPLKKDEVEVIRIVGFKFDPAFDARFDVYIAKLVNGEVTSSLGEYVGAFVHLPHSPGHVNRKREDVSNELCLGIGSQLKRIEAEESDELVVILVPRSGSVTVNPVRIVTIPEQSF